MKLQRHQIVAGGLLIFTFVGMLIGPLLLSLINSSTSWPCPPTIDSLCFDYWARGIAAPLDYTKLWPLVPIFSALLFVRKEIFSWWWKFSLPLAAPLLWWVISTPPLSGGFGLPESRAINARLASVAFLLLSLLIIAVTYLGYWLHAKWNSRKKLGM